MKKILVINPGSTSTKIAIFDTDEKGVKEEFSKSITHTPEELENLKNPIDQLELRTNAIARFLKESGVDSLGCIAARGGLVKPVAAGSYRINEAMLDDLSSNKYGTHASNLGALIADNLSKEYNCPALIADPVGVDEFETPARYSGFKGMERNTQAHALNIRATARRAAKEVGSEMEKMNLIVAHLGGGISVAPLKNGRIIDVNCANDGGPFSPQRSGSLPVTRLVDLCFSGKYSSAAELKYEITRNSGLVAYLGTDDGREIVKRIKDGDSKAEEVYRAMAYQIAKEIGAMAAVLNGKVDAIILTGGLPRPPLSDWIIEKTSWIAPIMIYAGEHEMEALAEAGQRHLFEGETLKEY